jgi:hypothetical protein
MKAEIVVGICIRLFALVLVGVAIRAVGTMMWVAGDDPSTTNRTILALSGAVPLTVALGLWNGAYGVARFVLRGANTDISPTAETVRNYVLGAVFVIGLFGVSQAISEILYWTAYFRLLAREGLDPALGYEDKASLFSAIAGAVISMGVVCYPGVIARFAFRAEPEGMPVQAHVSAPTPPVD